MQLCEFCAASAIRSDGTTCERLKRKNGTLFAPCECFERADGISQDHYEQVKALLNRVRGRAEAEAKDDRPEIHILMAFTEKEILGGFPRELLDDFLKMDPGDQVQVGKFLNRPEVLQYAAFDEREGTLDRNLKAVWSDLKGMSGRWTQSPLNFGLERIPLNIEGRFDVVAQIYSCYRADPFYMRSNEQTDFWRLNAWFSQTFEFNVDRDFEGVVKPYARLPYALGYWWGILYFLFARDVIEGQEYKRCLVCEVIFRPPKTGPEGLTCGKNACKLAASRYPERYGITPQKEC